MARSQGDGIDVQTQKDSLIFRDQTKATEEKLGGPNMVTLGGQGESGLGEITQTLKGMYKCKSVTHGTWFTASSSRKDLELIPLSTPQHFVSVSVCRVYHVL